MTTASRNVVLGAGGDPRGAALRLQRALAALRRLPGRVGLFLDHAHQRLRRLRDRAAGGAAGVRLDLRPHRPPPDPDRRAGARDRRACSPSRGADGVGWLFAARILQGIATGTAMGAISAALLDLQPRDKPWLGALMGAVSPLTGLALGALAAGLLVDYGPDPMRFVFWLLIAAFALAAARGARDPRDRGPRRRLARLAAPAGRRAGRDAAPRSSPRSRASPRPGRSAG